MKAQFGSMPPDSTGMLEKSPQDMAVEDLADSGHSNMFPFTTPHRMFYFTRSAWQFNPLVRYVELGGEGVQSNALVVLHLD